MPSKMPAVDGDTRRALHSQLRSSGASQGQLEIAGAGSWVRGFWPVGADLAFQGAESTAQTC